MLRGKLQNLGYLGFSKKTYKLNMLILGAYFEVYIHTVNFAMEIIIFELFHLKPHPIRQAEKGHISMCI